MRHHTTRREFLVQSSAAALGAAVWVSGSPARASRMAIDTINLTSVGAGGKARTDVRECVKLGANLVSLCDVDEARASELCNQFSGVPKYVDFRDMFEKQKDIDAVIVGINMLAEELEALNKHLEGRVAERTRQLADAHRQLERLALYDPLTDLANRTLLAERIDEAVAGTGRGGRLPAYRGNDPPR